MTTLDGLLAAVLADPTDDLPRLVMADWLEENGQPERAEFIRSETSHGQWVAIGSMAWMRWRRRRLLETKPFHSLLRKDTASHAKIRHGFVSAIRLPFARWVGETCDCVRIAESRGYWDNSPENCPLCSGDGRTGAIGPILVRRHPIERVEVTDREPMHYPGLPDERWHWLFSVREAVNCNYIRGPLNRDFSTRDAAIDALSSACLAWAKSAPAGPTAGAIGVVRR